MNNMEIVTIIAEVATVIIIGLLVVYVVPWLKAKIGEQQYKALCDAVNVAVNAAEQLWKNMPQSGEQKKAYVIEELARQGLHASDALIEAAVHELT